MNPRSKNLAIEEDKDGNFIVRNVANDLFSLLRDLGRSTTGCGCEQHQGENIYPLV
jgi:hypothetical protein